MTRPMKERWERYCPFSQRKCGSFWSCDSFSSSYSHGSVVSACCSVGQLVRYCGKWILC